MNYYKQPYPQQFYAIAHVHTGVLVPEYEITPSNKTAFTGDHVPKIAPPPLLNSTLDGAQWSLDNLLSLGVLTRSKDWHIITVTLNISTPWRN
jgi:hypothetical protein